MVACGRLEAGVRMPSGWDSPNDLSSWTELRGCDVCDRTFRPAHLSQVHCSRACKWRAHRIAERPVALRRCSHCSAPFESDQPHKMFCRRECQRAAARDREHATIMDNREGRACELCHGPVDEARRGRFCSVRCAQHSWYLRTNQHRRHRPQKTSQTKDVFPRTNGNGAVPNGHDHHHEDRQGTEVCPDHDFADRAPPGLTWSTRP